MLRVLHFDGQHGEGVPHFSADQDRLVQVLGVLIGYALKFTPAGGDVVVRTDFADGCVLLSVSDTGPGTDFCGILPEGRRTAGLPGGRDPAGVVSAGETKASCSRLRPRQTLHTTWPSGPALDTSGRGRPSQPASSAL
jgi:hypothetical protein